MPTTPPFPSPISSPPPQSSPLPTLSSTFPLTDPPSTPSPLRHPLRATKKLEQSAHIRAAKTEILSHVREDWTYPPSTHLRKRTTTIDTTWRERESDSSLAPSPLPSAHEDERPGHDPYRFENPDALGEIKEGRTRKRKRAVREEVAYNPGLRTFIHRRDLWTGAVAMPVSPPPPGTTPPSTAETLDPPTLVPVPPPLVPLTNAVRAAITPQTYPSIYSEIVVQGLAPTIPVNLGDVVRAMVEGWKRDGEWPPRSRYEEGEEGRRGLVEDGEGEGRVRRGVGRVKRVFGMGEKEEEREEDGG